MVIALTSERSLQKPFSSSASAVISSGLILPRGRNVGCHLRLLSALVINPLDEHEKRHCFPSQMSDELGPKAIRKHSAQYDLFHRLHSIAADGTLVRRVATDGYEGRFEVVGKPILNMTAFSAKLGKPIRDVVPGIAILRPVPRRVLSNQADESRRALQYMRTSSQPMGITTYGISTFQTNEGLTGV